MEDMKLTFEELSTVAGGQYDASTFIETTVVRNGKLYNIRQCNVSVGTISAGQTILVNPYFSYNPDGTPLCIVRVNGQDYVTEQENVAHKF